MRLGHLSAVIMLVAVVLAMIGLSVIGNRLIATEKRIDQHCRLEKSLLETSARRFMDPRSQRAEVDRFDPDAAYRELELCSTKRIDFSKHTTCWLNHDFACLADLARQVAAAL